MNLKKISIISGKGGVGKSMLASSLAILLAKDKKKIIAVDCDVDAPNLAVWLGQPEGWQAIKKLSVSKKPLIDNSKLTIKESKECVKKCKFNALKMKNGKLELDDFLCEGCGACGMFCPKGVIKMRAVKNGEIKTKETKYGFPLVSGQLFPGQASSGKIVTEIKKRADELFENLKWFPRLPQSFGMEIIDSAPGTGCPVTASLRDADFTLLVTEPTISGFSDLQRVLKVVEYFKIPWKVVINKYDINLRVANKIKNWSKDKFLGKISYDKKIFEAISHLRPIMETDLKAKKEIEAIYQKLKNFFPRF